MDEPKFIPMNSRFNGSLLSQKFVEGAFGCVHIIPLILDAAAFQVIKVRSFFFSYARINLVIDRILRGAKRMTF